MAPKHILNEPKTLVLDSLKGLVRLNPNVELDEEYKVISLKDVPQDKVAIISGGGSGHEPAHASFVGSGILSAAAAGNTFASPNTNQIKKALELVENKKGTLIVIKQYTGDVLHFGLAKEQYAAANPGSNLRFIAVGEDVAVGREQGKMVGRRGLAGTVLVYKLAGACAAAGGSLDEVTEVADYVARHTGTIGMGLEHCHVPGTAEQHESHLGENQAELGMGIHNESGIKTIAIPTTNDIVKEMVDRIMDTEDKDRSFVPFSKTGKGDRVVLLVNNLGAVSELELGGIVGSSVDYLESKGVEVVRVLAGTYMSSLSMPGFSITLFLLPSATSASSPLSFETLLKYLDAPGDAPGWKWHSASPAGSHSTAAPTKKHEETTTSSTSRTAPTDGKLFISAIKKACEDVVAAEPEITRMDTIAGDGDCGLCAKAGAEGVLEAISSNEVSSTDVVAAIVRMAEAMEKYMDGTSGALYAIFFNALASGMAKTKVDVAGSKAWAEALDFALNSLYTYTRARSPSRTLIDPLSAFVAAYSAKPDDLNGAIKAGVDAAALTATYQAKAGRAAYVSREMLKEANVPDPGAHTVGVILTAIGKVVQ